LPPSRSRRPTCTRAGFRNRPAARADTMLTFALPYSDELFRTRASIWDMDRINYRPEKEQIRFWCISLPDTDDRGETAKRRPT
jgi:hypothetical protein